MYVDMGWMETEFEEMVAGYFFPMQLGPYKNIISVFAQWLGVPRSQQKKMQETPACDSTSTAACSTKTHPTTGPKGRGMSAAFNSKDCLGIM